MKDLLEKTSVSSTVFEDAPLQSLKILKSLIAKC